MLKSHWQQHRQHQHLRCVLHSRANRHQQHIHDQNGFCPYDRCKKVKRKPTVFFSCFTISLPPLLCTSTKMSDEDYGGGGGGGSSDYGGGGGGSSHDYGSSSSSSSHDYGSSSHHSSSYSAPSHDYSSSSTSHHSSYSAPSHDYSSSSPNHHSSSYSALSHDYSHHPSHQVATWGGSCGRRSPEHVHVAYSPHSCSNNDNDDDATPHHHCCDNENDNSAKHCAVTISDADDNDHFRHRSVHFAPVPRATSFLRKLFGGGSSSKSGGSKKDEFSKSPWPGPNELLDVEGARLSSNTTGIFVRGAFTNHPNRWLFFNSGKNAATLVYAFNKKANTGSWTQWRMFNKAGQNISLNTPNMVIPNGFYALRQQAVV